MKNILRSLLGDKAYKQLLKLIGNGGSSDGISAIKIKPRENLPFVSENRIVYTSLSYGEDAAEADIQQYQGLIDANIKFANSIIQNYNSDKGTFFSIEFNDSKNIISVGLSAEDEVISVGNSTSTLCIIPVTFSLDGKATLRDYPYTITGK